MPGIQPSLYEQLTIGKLSQQGPYPDSPPGGRLRAPTALRITANFNQNIKEATKAATILYQTTTQFVFQPDIPEFSPKVLTDWEEYPTLPASAETAHASQVLTKTAAPDTATPEAVGSGKRNSNRARSTEGKEA